MLLVWVVEVVEGVVSNGTLWNVSYHCRVIAAAVMADAAVGVVVVVVVVVGSETVWGHTITITITITTTGLVFWCFGVCVFCWRATFSKECL